MMPMQKPKKVQRRPLKAVVERPSQERDTQTEPMWKLSVMIPERLKRAIKLRCAENDVQMKDWIIGVLSDATGEAKS